MALEKIPAAGLEAGSVNATAIAVNSIPSSRLTTTGVVANSYGNSSQIPVITVDEAGRVTNASTTAVAGVTGFSYEGANNTFSITTGDGSTFRANISANSIAALALGSSGVVANVYGNSTAIPVITVDEDGRISNATTTSVSGVTGVTYTPSNSTLTVSTSISDYTAPLTAGNSSVQGLLKVVDSVANGSTDIAASANSVKAAYELAGNAVSNATSYAATAYSNAVSTAASDATSKAGTAYSNAVSVASSDATSKSDTAYSNAVSVASSDATSKAGTAYSNAVSTASSDATSKAGTAYSNAVSYADTKADTSYSNAVSTASSDATSKAGTAYSNAVSTASSDATSKAATSYSNATTFASNADNISSGTLSGARVQANNGIVGNTSGVFVKPGTGVSVNATGVHIGQDVSNTANVTFGYMTITGNLVVQGTTTTVNTVTLSVQDNMIYLNANNTVSNPDLGFAGNYNDGTYHHAGFFRDTTDARWKVFDNYLPEPDASAYIDTSNTSFHLADFQANVVYANVTGNVTGNVSGSANSATYLGGNTASDLRSYSSTIAGTAYSNAVSVASSDATSKAATAYSNATSYAATIAGTAYSNAVAYAASNSYVNSTFLPLAGGTMTGSVANATFSTKTIISGANAQVPSTADNSFNGILGLRATGARVRLLFGLQGDSPYGSWIQSTYDNGGGADGVEPLLLNPLGGLVTIASNTSLGYALGVNGSFATNDQARAPIFYDYSDTGYYVDPASTSTSVNINGGISTPTMWVNYSTSNYNGYNENIRLYPAGNGVSVIAFGASGASGTPWNSILGFSDHFEIRQGGQWELRSYADYVAAYGSFRAPIFYDSDDTGYYLNAGYNTSGYASTHRSGILIGPNYTWGASLLVGGDGKYAYGVNNTAIASVCTTDGNLHLDASSGHGTYINYYDGVDCGIYAGDSTGNYVFKVFGSSNYSQGAGSIRAPIFYDSDDTGYYVDPASTSSAKFAGYMGLGGNAYNTNMSGTFGASIYHASYPSVGFFTAAGPNYLIYRMGNAGPLTVWNSSTNETAYFYTGYTTFTGSARAPIFYDSGDTNFYVDPASTSSLSGLYVASVSKLGAKRSYSLGTLGAAGTQARRYEIARMYIDYNDWHVGGVFQVELHNRYFYGGDYQLWNISYDYNNVSCTLISGDSPRGRHGQVTCSSPVQISGDYYYISVYVDVDYYTSYYTFIHTSWPETTTHQADSGVVLVYASPSGSNISGFTASTTVSTTNIVQSTASVRGPIFYDSDDTNYYIDPTNLSYIKRITFNHGVNNGSTSAPTVNICKGWTGMATAIYDTVAIQANDVTSIRVGEADGTHGGYCQGDGYNTFTSTSPMRFYTEGTAGNYIYNGMSGALGLYITGSSARSPIFYDYDDTNYYSNPAGTSSFNVIKSNALAYQGAVSTDNTWGIFFDNALNTSYGIYRESGAWNHPYPDLRIAFHTGIKLGANPSYGGIRFYTDYDMSTQVMSVNNSADGLGGGNVYVNNSLVAGSDLRAPAFYDSNDTSYYSNPAGSSTFSQASFTASSYPLFVTGSGSTASSSTVGLQVYSSGGSGAIMAFHRGGYYAVNMGLDSDNVIRIGGWSASSNRLQMDMSGNLTMAGNVTAYSDIRLKENIEVIANAVSKVKQIRGVTYTRNDDENKTKRHAGVIAQEVEVVLPEVVSEDNSGIKNVAYGNMVGLLVEAIKEQQSTIERLEALVNSLINK